MSTKSVPLWFIVLCQVLYLISTVVQGSFNLYMSSDEMKRILGLSKELYYVREGVVNEYALNFIVTVPANINVLQFTWQALGTKPLPYSSSIESSDSLAMAKPTMSIPSKGLIPITEPQTFQVFLPCTNDLSDEVQLNLTFNVTSYVSFRTPSNTTVTLRRKKICLEDPSLKFGVGVPTAFTSPPVGRGHPTESPPTSRPPPSPNKKLKNKHLTTKEPRKDRNDLLNISGQDATAPDNSNLIYIVLGCVMGLLACLIAVAMAAISIVRSRNKGTSEGAESSDFLHIDTSGNCSSGSGSGSGVSASGGSLFIRAESPHHYSSVSPGLDSDAYTYSTFHPSNAMNVFYSEIATVSKKNHSSRATTMDSTASCKLADKMTIARCKVRLQNVIMEGTFAKIYNGTVLEKDGMEKKVIVKTVSDHSSAVQMALLLHEGLSLVGIVQEHVFTVIGVAAEERVPPFLIYPDDGFRNLKRFLQRCRSGPGRLITAQEILHMAVQIASGIAFLHRQNVTHRDVAARNCVVDDKLTVKVSDSALSKDLFPEDYHWMGEAECRPVKWMPPEVILHHSRASPQADMWSFGVVLWELATLAQQPYAEMEFDLVVPFLKMGYRLSQPINCPDELYSSMTRCWTWDSDDRPKWVNMLRELQTLHAQLALYV